MSHKIYGPQNINLGIRSKENAISANENRIPRRQSTKVQKATKNGCTIMNLTESELKNYAAKSVMKKNAINDSRKYIKSKYSVRLCRLEYKR